MSLRDDDDNISSNLEEESSEEESEEYMSESSPISILENAYIVSIINTYENDINDPKGEGSLVRESGIDIKHIDELSDSTEDIGIIGTTIVKDIPNKNLVQILKEENERIRNTYKKVTIIIIHYSGHGVSTTKEGIVGIASAENSGNIILLPEILEIFSEYNHLLCIFDACRTKIDDSHYSKYGSNIINTFPLRNKFAYILYGSERDKYARSNNKIGGYLTYSFYQAMKDFVKITDIDELDATQILHLIIRTLCRYHTNKLDGSVRTISIRPSLPSSPSFPNLKVETLEAPIFRLQVNDRVQLNYPKLVAEIQDITGQSDSSINALSIINKYARDNLKLIEQEQQQQQQQEEQDKYKTPEKQQQQSLSSLSPKKRKLELKRMAIQESLSPQRGLSPEALERIKKEFGTLPSNFPTPPMSPSTPSPSAVRMSFQKLLVGVKPYTIIMNKEEGTPLKNLLNTSYPPITPTTTITTTKPTKPTGVNTTTNTTTLSMIAASMKKKKEEEEQQQQKK